MDAEPKALRISIILTIAFVLFGTMAGSFLFFLGKSNDRTGGTLSGADLDSISTRPMSPPSNIDAATLARLNQLIPIALLSAAPDERRSAGEGLLDLGVVAVPSLLDAVNRMATGDKGFERPEIRQHLTFVDAVLRRIRLTLTPESPADPMPADPNPTWLMRRAKSWFAWWDAYAARHPDAK